MRFDGFTFYCGAASGSGRKALRHCEESDVMISYATYHNEPWKGVDRLFLDNGAYSLLSGGEYEDTARDYYEHIQHVEPDLYTLRDVLASPDSVAEAQERTVELHRECMELHDSLGIEATPVCVLQGWEPEDYLEHLDMMAEAGVLTDYVGIGSLKRNSTGNNRPQTLQETQETVREIILTVNAALSVSFDVHAYGATVGAESGVSGVLQCPDVRNALTSSDSQSYEYAPKEVFPNRWKNVVSEYCREMEKLSNHFTPA